MEKEMQTICPETGQCLSHFFSEPQTRSSIYLRNASLQNWGFQSQLRINAYRSDEEQEEDNDDDDDDDDDNGSRSCNYENSEQEVIVKFNSFEDVYHYYKAHVTVRSPVRNLTSGSARAQCVDAESLLFGLEKPDFMQENYSNTEHSELDSNTSSTTILIWPEEELDDELNPYSALASCSYITATDRNQSHNTPKGDSLKRPHSRFAHFHGSGAPRALRSTLVSSTLHSISRSRDFGHESTLSQHSNPETLIEQEQTASRMTVVTLCSPKATSKDSDSSAGRWGLRIRAIQPSVPELRSNRDTKEQIKDLEQITKMTQKTQEISCTVYKPCLTALVAPIPIDIVELHLGELRSLTQRKSPTGCLLQVYELCQACTVQSQPASHMAVSVPCGEARSFSTLPDDWDEGGENEEVLDSANPNIMSPIVENELTPQSTIKLFEHFNRTSGDREVIANCNPTSLLCSAPPSPTKISLDHQVPDIHGMTAVLAVNRRKSRRRVKISLQQGPMPSEEDSPNLIVRLRIEPRSDSESVISRRSSQYETKSRATSLSATRYSAADATLLKYDTFDGREISSWVPIDYRHMVHHTSRTHSEERERFNGIAECLITSLSSLSIPVSEVESIDTSLSWSLLDSSRPPDGFDRKPSSLPEAVIVEVLSDVDAHGEQIEQPSPIGSDTGVYYIELESSKEGSCRKRIASPSARVCGEREKWTIDEPTHINEISTDPGRLAKRNSDLSGLTVFGRDSATRAIRHRQHLQCHVAKSAATSKPISRVVPWAYAAPSKRASQCMSSVHAQQLYVDREQGDTVLDLAVTDTTDTPRVTRLSSSLVKTRTKQEASVVGSNWKVVKQKPLESSVDWSSVDDRSHEASISVSGMTNKVESSKPINRIRHLQMPTPVYSWRPAGNTDSFVSAIKKSSIRSSSWTTRKQNDHGRTGIAKPIYSHTIGSELCAKRFLSSRKKPLFRSGEMTISEFEELRKRIDFRIDPRRPKTKQPPTEKASITKVARLSSIANTLSESTQPAIDVTHKSIKFSFCISRQYSTENSTNGCQSKRTSGDQSSRRPGRNSQKRSMFRLCTAQGEETPDALWQSGHK